MTVFEREVPDLMQYTTASLSHWKYSLAWPLVSPCVACNDNRKELIKFNRELKLLSGPGHTQPLSGTVSYGSTGICLQLHVRSWGPLIEEEEGISRVH